MPCHHLSWPQASSASPPKPGHPSWGAHNPFLEEPPTFSASSKGLLHVGHSHNPILLSLLCFWQALLPLFLLCLLFWFFIFLLTIAFCQGSFSFARKGDFSICHLGTHSSLPHLLELLFSFICDSHFLSCLVCLLSFGLHLSPLITQISVVKDVGCPRIWPPLDPSRLKVGSKLFFSKFFQHLGFWVPLLTFCQGFCCSKGSLDIEVLGTLVLDKPKQATQTFLGLVGQLVLLLSFWVVLQSCLVFGPDFASFILVDILLQHQRCLQIGLQGSNECRST